MAFSDAGFYDRLVVTEVIKGAAETQQLLKGVQKPFKGMDCVYSRVFPFSS